jgi:phosphate transport system substrate-binding protein
VRVGKRTRQRADVKEYSPVARIRLACAAAALIPIALLAAACSSNSSSPPPKPKATGPALSAVPPSGSVSLSETGSTLLFPLFGAWASAYKTSYSNVAISSAGTGSGTGISDATTGTVDIGASDAYLSSSVRASTPTLMNIAVAISAQQINYNLPTVKTPLKLDGTVIAKIYTGKITTWNDPAIAALNPGVSLPSMKIVPLHRAESSGDTFLFTSYLTAQDPSDWPSTLQNTSVSWPSVTGALAETGNSGMVAGCKATPGCIAYIGIAYLSKTQAAGLGQAELKNGSGTYEAPSAATISAEASSFSSSTPANESISLINGTSAPSGYPIVNYEYLIVNQTQSDTTKAAALRAFIYWAITTGQGSTYLNAVNFQPLPSSVVTLSETQIKKIGS